MTVKELIEQLTKFDPESVVLRSDTDGTVRASRVQLASDGDRGWAELWGEPAVIIS